MGYPLNQFCFIFINRSILFSRGGCVLKRFMIVPPDKGLTMNMWAVDGLASMGICLAALDSFARALANASGFPETLAPPASASYSLDLDMAIWINVAATGATMATATVFIMPLSSLPLKNMAHRDNKTTALAMVAAMVLIRISLCLIWESSWAMTPSNSRR